MMRARRGDTVAEFGSLGDGPTVVLLPGRGGEGPEQYDVLGPALAAAGFRAVAVNLRGVGNSAGTLDELSLHGLARDIAGVIKATGAPAHLVGRALGNRVARCTAMDFPAMVKSVTLLAAGGLVPPHLDQPLANPQRPRRQLRYWRAAGQAHEHAAQSTPLDEWWPGGNAPMLIVQGLADRIAVPENGRRLAADYPDRVRLREIPGAGHGVLFERPDIVVPEVIAFVQTIERSWPGEPRA
jgi:pimeloyl-ACP methyl ester carboxylesterase